METRRVNVSPNHETAENVIKAREKSIRAGELAAYEYGKTKGYRTGFIRGALTAFALTSALTIGAHSYLFLTHKYPPNISYDKAVEAFHGNSNTSYNKEQFSFMVDFYNVATEYDPETMDLDSFLAAIYQQLFSVGQKKREDDMNTLVYQLYIQNKTEYSSFVSYCDSRGLCIVDEDGNKIVDYDKYHKALNEYLKNYRVWLEANSVIEEFRGGNYSDEKNQIRR